ncbi:DNA primase [Candidatus Uhrbacteria bacterium CG10_big_fil_rev_8_21_14_0_10_50_16]|uniref:DNA primase n=1 Tax=Candidatus Uhrbacteria bacterium CG10_big_fil_rev_8_21_14_0_10_50_16 TaxID=1975039 RepID=A0A2H0RMQ0_9BACT|nr:MAG: DNA primase [Candidatus Uhrbacteria bacterium CG10_big_fil_rev_8_21_14_0_10_50_16]
MEPKEEIRERLDVVDVVGEYLTLKGAGQGSFKACCPFHGEKTPSFYVNRQKQIWHCFGCDKGGDSFAFIMEMEGVEFPEALRILAQKAGVELPVYERKDADKTTRLQSINLFAQRVFQKYLTSESGEETRAYLQNRGINTGLVEKFGLGYAPKSWDALVSLAGQKDIGVDELIDAGVALRSKGGTGNVIDRFRNRLMIPLRDHHGNTVGFTGRVLDLADSPKYMNSPQTPIYDKSALMFGLDVAKTAIKVERAVVIVEGNLDVVASHKAGVENVVASSGTALTERHIGLLKRYTTTLIFSFDADAAGFEAARRGMRLASSLGCDVRVAMIPEGMGKDPDDLVQKDPAQWQQVVQNHIDKMQFLFQRLVANIDLHSVQAKKDAGKAFLPEIAAIADRIEREHWMKRFAETVDVPLATVREMVASQSQKKVETGAVRTISIPVSKPASRHREQAYPVIEGVAATSISDKTMELLFSLALADRESLKQLVEGLSEDTLSLSPYKALYVQLVLVYTTGNLSPEKSLFEVIRARLATQEPDLIPFVDRIALAYDHYVGTESSSQSDMATLQDLISQVKDRSKREQRASVLAELKRAEHAQDPAQIQELTRRYQSLL